MRRAVITIPCWLLLLAAAAVDARADDAPVAAPGLTPPAPAVAASAPPARVYPRWMVTVGGLVRATGRDREAAAEREALAEYGWVPRDASLTGLRADVAYTRAPLVDLGVALAWGRGHYASGPVFDDPDHVRGSALEAGLFARLHWVPPRFPVAAEPRAEVGVTRTGVAVRGIEATRTGTYARVGLDVRIGAPHVGALLGIDYTAVTDGGDGMLDVPTGGVTFALSLYWRQFE